MYIYIYTYMYIYIYTFLPLQESAVISNNQASDGGGIYADNAYVTIRDSATLSSNVASGYFGGGALHLARSVLWVPRTNGTLTIRDNQGTSGAKLFETMRIKSLHLTLGYFVSVSQASFHHDTHSIWSVSTSAVVQV